MQTNKIVLDDKIADDVRYYMPKDQKCRDLADFFSLFSDSTRIKIISALAVSEMCVNDISSILELNQTTVSHQLKLLKTMGTVKYRREGKIIYYSIADQSVNDCLLTGVDYLQSYKSM
jgi:ArsR family transcriptional regulator